MTLPLLAFLDRIDRVLVVAGFPATSPWWRAELERFLRSGRRRWVIRAGRRAGKSSTLCRLAVAVALAGDWSIPPGDRAVVAIVSVDRDEAAGRLRTIRAILDALHVPYSERADELELRDRPLVFSVATCSVRSVGFTSILVIADEAARWESRDTAANPAREVLASLRPTMATVPTAFEVLSSSPWSLDDYHAELFDLGNTAHQLVSFAPTWAANPTLTEERTHELEPDPRVWSREYAAVPAPARGAAFDADAVAGAFEPRNLEGYDRAERVIVIDAASGGSDAFTWAVLGWNIDRAHLVRDSFGNVQRWPPAAGGAPMVREGTTQRPPFLSVGHLDGLAGGFWGTIDGDEIVSRIAAAARKHGARVVHGDQRERLMLEAAFRRHHLRFVEHVYTGATKPRAVEIVRRWLRDGVIALPSEGRGELLRRELLAFEERLSPSGQLTFGARGSGHDDHVALLITAALAESEGQLPRSPWRRHPARGMGQTSIGLL